MTAPVTLPAGYFDAMYQARPIRGASRTAGTNSANTRSAWPSSRPPGTAGPSSPAAPSACSPRCSPGAATRSWRATSPGPRSAPPPGAPAELPHVRVEQRDIAGQWPSGRFDLIVFSEILYYFGDHDLEQVLKNAVAALEPEGTLLAVHWRHPVTDYPRSGDDVHRVLAAQPGLGRLVRHTEPDFLAEVYLRTDGTPVSVAQATGLV